MLKLGGSVIEIHSGTNLSSKVISVSTNRNLPKVLKETKAYIATDSEIPDGFGHYLIFESDKTLTEKLPHNADYTLLSDDYKYLGHDDVVRLSRDGGSIRVLVRAASPHNTILVTEQCNHYCLMCSQPPKKNDDSWILEEIKELIPLIPKYIKEIGFTGGEPTIYGNRFLDILKMTKNYLPETSVHILSNGRTFKDLDFASMYAGVGLKDVMVGIPIYSDDPTLHDYIVQAEGAFDETIQGILNLKRLNQKVEIRVVIHKQSVPRLKQLCEFIARNLLFVDHVALMGLEMMGFTRANLDKLWIDPHEYRDTLSEAVSILTRYGMTTSIYNHQLCLVNSDVLPYYRKSISDWKNEYAQECNECTKKIECGGFFSSGIKFGYSNHLKPYI